MKLVKYYAHAVVLMGKLAAEIFASAFTAPRLIATAVRSKTPEVAPLGRPVEA